MKRVASFVAATALIALVATACKQPQPNASNTNSVKAAPTAQAEIKGECGTLVLVKDAIYLQVVSNNSDVGGDRLLEPQDGATENILRDGAEKMNSVCIDADFSLPDPIMVKSAAQIQPFTAK
jgi:hypothetical protein